ncbi:hypothetical protein Tco_0566602 [Tanacetum coccineum]
MTLFSFGHRQGQNEAPHIVSTFTEQTPPQSNEVDEGSNEEDNAELDGNEFINPFSTLVSNKAESSSRNLDPPNMHMLWYSRLNVVPFLRPRLSLDIGLHPLTVDADVLELAKYVKDNKIILVYIEQGTTNVETIFATPKKGEFDKRVEREETDPFDNLDEILGDYANTRRKNIGKEIIVHVDNSSTIENMVDCDMLYETEEVGPMGNFKEVEVDMDNEIEEESDESDIEENDASGSKANDSEDLDYDPKNDEGFDDDEHILEDVPVSMNNFNFNLDTKPDLSVVTVEVHEHDQDVINYDSFDSDLDDEIDPERRGQLMKLRRIGKAKNQGPNKYYFYLGQQFAHKEIMKGRFKKHSVETRRKLILVKNNKERLRVICEGTIPTLVPFVGSDSAMGKILLLQTRCCPVISGKQNFWAKKKVKGKGKKADGRSIQDQQQKQFNVGISKMKAFRAKRIASDKMIALEQGFKAHGREILGLNGCFMSGPFPCQILIAVGVEANNGIYSVAYVIVEVENKASWCWFLKLIREDLGRAKCDLLLNNICEVFNRQLVDGRDQPIITFLEYIEYLKKSIVVAHKVIEKTVGPPTPTVSVIFDALKRAATAGIHKMSENGMGVVEFRILILPAFHKTQVGRPPKKRKKSVDKLASQSCSTGKLSRKGKSVKCSKCRNLAPNQVAGARNNSSQVDGYGQPSAAPSQESQGLSQAASSQHSATTSQASRGLSQAVGSQSSVEPSQ